MANVDTKTPKVKVGAINRDAARTTRRAGLASV
jgi:hypothetical protein